MEKKKDPRKRTPSQKTSDFPCHFCVKEVFDGIQCDICDIWIHAECLILGVDINVLRSPNILFRCNQCLSLSTIKSTLTDIRVEIEKVKLSVTFDQNVSKCRFGIFEILGVNLPNW